jgi:hypothetical protein
LDTRRRRDYLASSAGRFGPLRRDTDVGIPCRSEPVGGAMTHVPASKTANTCIRNVDFDRKLKCPCCGKKSAWLDDAEDESGVWAARKAAISRMRQLALVLYFEPNPETYAKEFEKVLSLPL